MANIHVQKYSKYHETIKTMFEEGKKDSEIAFAISVPAKTIGEIRRRLGLRHRSRDSLYRQKYYDIDSAALQLITEEGYSITKAAKELKVDMSALSRRLKAFCNLKVLTDGKKYVNSMFFHSVQAEVQAYWLGFIAADGYIGTKNDLEVTLQKRDRTHLEKLKLALESNHKIGTKEILLNGKTFHASRLSIKDQQIVNDLNALGIVNAKSLVIQMPDLNSLELYRHFLRGYFDGNGNIKHYGNYIGFSFHSGSFCLLKSIQDHAKEIVHVKTYLSHKSKNAYELSSSSRTESFRYLDFLYHDATVFLDRKYAIYQAICRAESILSETSYNEDGIKRGWRNVQ